jgi:hypothetical protein
VHVGVSEGMICRVVHLRTVLEQRGVNLGIFEN